MNMHIDAPADLAAFLMICARCAGADYETFAAALALMNAAAADRDGPAALAAELSRKGWAIEIVRAGDCGEGCLHV